MVWRFNFPFGMAYFSGALTVSLGRVNKSCDMDFQWHFSTSSDGIFEVADAQILSRDEFGCDFFANSWRKGRMNTTSSKICSQPLYVCIYIYIYFVPTSILKEHGIELPQGEKIFKSWTFIWVLFSDCSTVWAVVKNFGYKWNASPGHQEATKGSKSPHWVLQNATHPDPWLSSGCDSDIALAFFV